MDSLFIIVFVTVFVIITVVEVVTIIRKGRTVVREVKSIVATVEAPTSFSSAAAVGAIDSSDLGQVLASLPARFDRSAAGDLNAVLQLHVTDHEPADWHLDIADGSCQVAQGQATAVTTTASATEQTWMDILNGKTSYDSAFMDGTIQTSGDATLMMRLSHYFPDAKQRAITGLPMPESAGQVAVAGDVDLPRTVEGAIIAGYLKALREVPRDLPPDERKRAIVEALKQRVGAEAALKNSDHGDSGESEYERWGTLFGATGRSHEQISEAIKDALAALPANASHTDKLKAVQEALRD